MRDDIEPLDELSRTFQGKARALRSDQCMTTDLLAAASSLQTERLMSSGITSGLMYRFVLPARLTSETITSMSL